MVTSVAQALPRPQLSFPSKTWCFGIHLNFRWQKSLSNQYLPHSESKILPNKFLHEILLIKIFPTTPKAHSNSSEILSYDLIKFSVKKSFNIQELLHRKSKRSLNQKPMHLSSWRVFQRHQEHDLKHSGFSGSHNYKTKQNKLPSFIDR
jgi:hypothetical protein